MKTVLVVYTEADFLTSKEIAGKRKYSFNTEEDLIEGDIVESSEYDTPMMVVKALDTAYKYYNSKTGELSDTFNSTAQWKIRTLVIRENDDELVYGTLRKRKF